MTAVPDRRERRPDRSATRREMDTYGDQVRAEAGLPPVFEAPLLGPGNDWERAVTVEEAR